MDFTLFRSLAELIPQVTLDQSIIRLREGLVGMGFADKDFGLRPICASRHSSVTWRLAVSVRIYAGASGLTP